MEQQTINPFDKLRVNSEQSRTIKCAFCKGEGKNPYFRGTCPVCKGSGENQVTGKYMACGDCRGSGQKRGTTLTCYSCGGFGVIPDTRQELRQARQEIKKVREEMEKEKDELGEKQPKVGRKASRQKQRVREFTNEDREEDLQMAQKSEHLRFCQSCAKSMKGDDLVKVCLECFQKIKQGS